MQISIGLPAFLVNQDTKTTVVMVYVGILVIFVPILVFYWCVEKRCTRTCLALVCARACVRVCVCVRIPCFAAR